MASASSPPTLPVVETFHSLQGEGIHAGRGAFFLRLAGCEVGCPWCDTKHSWSEATHPRLTLDELARQATLARKNGAAFVVVTGGEPLQHNLGPLCAALSASGLPLHLETSGVPPLSGRFDWITLSPKRHRPPDEGPLAACDELKVVVERPDDLPFAEAMASRALALRQAKTPGESPPAPALLLQPAWGDPEGQRLAIDHVRSHPTWRLSLQSHKWLGVR
ncbi:MAG: 7-carboxy-7-deazaguanine synthase QueE [Cyanobacteriota bacterium]|jgi:7-carboxy-7-deazaguanine synthase